MSVCMCVSVCVCVRMGGCWYTHMSSRQMVLKQEVRDRPELLHVCVCVCEHSGSQETGANSQQICWFRTRLRSSNVHNTLSLCPSAHLSSPLYACSSVCLSSACLSSVPYLPCFIAALPLFSVSLALLVLVKFPVDLGINIFVTGRLRCCPQSP